MNKLFLILLSFVIAVGLWLYVVSTVTPEGDQWIYRIPVEFVNEDGLFSDRNLVLASGRGTTVDLRLRGKRQDLLKLSSSNITITADLSQVTGEGEWRLPYEVEFPDSVSASSISIDRRSVYSINVVVDRLATKDGVEIRAVFQGDVAEGYTPDAIELEFDSLTVSGPRDQVDLVSYAQVILERTNVSKSVSDTLSFTLMDQDGNPVESDDLRCTVGGVTVDKVGVLMQVNMLKEVPLRVELIEGGGATESHAVVDIQPAGITLKGDPEILAGLNSVYLGTVDLAQIQTSVTEEFTIVIPDGLINMTGTTASVTVELRNLKTRTFRVTNIEYTNAPEGLQAKLGTISLSVQVRGPEETVNSLASGSIRAVADLSGINAIGQFSVPATIYVDGVSDVGAMGSYSVLVTISEPTEEATVELETDASATVGDLSEAAATPGVTEEDTQPEDEAA